MSFSSFSIGMVETAFNAALDQDLASKKALAELSGALIAFEVTNVGLTLYFVPGKQKTLVLVTTEDQPDCIFSGTLSAFLAMFSSDNKADAILNKQITIRGNTGLAHRFGDVLGNIDFDWEEQLSQLTGDIPAHFAGNLVRSVGHYGKALLHTGELNAEEYLVEELRTNPHRLEMEEFVAGVDKTRDDVERLQQRIEQLRKQQQ